MATTSEVDALGGELEQVIRPRRHPLRSLANIARQNPLGVLGFLIIFILTIVAIFAPLIAPFDV